MIVNISVSLFSGLMPIPGGIGVAEAGLTWGLVQSGVPGGGGVRRGDPLPAGDVLPPADLGLRRVQLAAEEPAPVATRQACGHRGHVVGARDGR